MMNTTGADWIVQVSPSLWFSEPNAKMSPELILPLVMGVGLRSTESHLEMKDTSFFVPAGQLAVSSGRS